VGNEENIIIDIPRKYVKDTTRNKQKNTLIYIT